MVQLSTDLLALLDARAKRESVSRSQVIREAVERYLHEDAEAARYAQVVEAYRHQPPSVEEMTAAEANARALVEEESW